MTATGPIAAAPAPRPVRVIVKLRNTSAQAAAVPAAAGGKASAPAATTPEMQLQTLLARHGARAAAPLSPGHVRARQQANAPGGKAQAAAQAPRFARRAARAPANAVKPDLSTTYVLDLGLRSPADVAATLQALRADANVLYAEEDKVAQAFYVPNDPSYASTGSWGQSYDDLHGLKAIGTAAAWDTTRGQGIIVAVVDTGVDYNHPDISANIWTNAGEIPGNGVDDDNNGFIDDVRGWDFIGSTFFIPTEDNDPQDFHFHGTHVAGTIAATGDNNLGVVGVAWQAMIMPVKGLDDSGHGGSPELARAILYATDNGADIINASWGGFGSSQAIADAVAYAHAQGVVFVAAAGNSSRDVSDQYPANHAAAIAVSALDPSGALAGFSNFGSKIDVAAPGVDILSLENQTTGYRRLQGTSMAAPHVSGVAALVLAAHPAFSVEQVRAVLRASATDLGPAGRDANFGSGRVEAAAALAVTEVTTARLLTPTGYAVVDEPVTITGSAAGPRFDHYVLEYGAGDTPSVWNTLVVSSTAVENGSLGSLDLTRLPNGVYSVRLQVFEANGAMLTDEARFIARYSRIASPAPPTVPPFSLEFRSGATLQINGTARAAGFESYRLEWASGLNPTSGWSSQGITLAGGGALPVASGALGEWTTTADMDGYITLRLTVTAAGFSSVADTTVCAQSALFPGNWPRFAGNGDFRADVRPVRQPDGTYRLLLSDANSGSVRLFALDGSEITRPSVTGSFRPPAVADLDGQPGDEIAMPDGQYIKILTHDLTLVRTIDAGPDLLHGRDPVVLADLDADGVPEIIAPARDMSEPIWWPTVKLRVFRADGTPYSANYPMTISTTDVYSSMGLNVVPVDLDQDGVKEIVLGYQNPNGTDYTVKAINADGTPYGGWSEVMVTDHLLFTMAAGDLDHDGLAELVISEWNSVTPKVGIRVLDPTGAIRPGWPVPLSRADNGPPEIALADLDGDQHCEIVAYSTPQVDVLRADGSLQRAWTVASTAYSVAFSMAVADVDGDGRPEIILPTTEVNLFQFPTYYHSTLAAYDGRTGSSKRVWQIMGIGNRQSTIVTPCVGDFDGDGKTDITAHISLTSVIDGANVDSGITLLKTNGLADPVVPQWNGRYGNLQNSRARPMPLLVAPSVAASPANTEVALGGTTSLAVTANGTPLNYQWRRNGVDVANGGRFNGVAGPVLTISNAQSADAGNYDVVVRNARGQATSQTAALTVISTFDAWVQTKFTAGELLVAAISGPNADPDADGLGNLLEYALGLEPKIADTAVLPQAGVMGADWTYTYTRPADRSDVLYEVEYSTDLTTWGSGGVVHEKISTAAGVDTWRATYPTASAPNCFFRLKVTQL